ncbi:hypothetical protein M0C34_19185 [Agarivorans sp. TSD2052]|uniref:hypothetical protein n=1 Tax=Agarivorans sp. TSD2052 TaxID=2937286 RepID=UPI00200D5367|nr:hypothetical protein [Agarivorans sp. TSD2052]UPW18322.1 hypothetical protein M0C34_19185 [Agarivorans sp. TSD2052]
MDYLNVTDKVQGFAQGLLVEAVEAYFAFGLVGSICRGSYTPSPGAKKVLPMFGSAAKKHGFKSAKGKDVADVKIYERLRDRLAHRFGNTSKWYAARLASVGNAHSGLRGGLRNGHRYAIKK